MNLVSSARVKFETLRKLEFGDIDGNYSGVGGFFENPIRILTISNTTDEDMIISYNGIDDHDFVAKNSFVLYDYSANKADQCGFFEQSARTRVYVKSEDSIPTFGAIYVTAIYASQV